MSIDTFRTASQADVEAIAKLVNEAYRPASGASGWTHESDLVSGNRTSANGVAELIAKPDSVVLVGIEHSAVVACVHIAKNGSDCHIGMLAVSPTLQGGGAGKKMLSHAEEYARHYFRAEKFVMLVVSARSELIAFYLRRGYQQTGAAMDFPLSAGAGVPKRADLKVEVLEKRFAMTVV